MSSPATPTTPPPTRRRRRAVTSAGGEEGKSGEGREEGEEAVGGILGIWRRASSDIPRICPFRFLFLVFLLICLFWWREMCRVFGSRVVNACRALSLSLGQRRIKVLNAREAVFH